MPIVLITGAGRDECIAAGVAAHLRGAGWTVITSDRTVGDFPCDLADPAGPERLVASVNAAHGPIEALVLSHAHGVESGILDTTAESFDAHIAVNARASLLLIAAFARQAPATGGAVVALTSDHTTGNLPCGASKGALDRIVISAARELGTRGISANVLNPGPVDTGWMDDGIRAATAEHTPLGRLGTPEDIARIVAFLISPSGRWTSGQLLNADGALSARY